jgi:hypothetical protein
MGALQRNGAKWDSSLFQNICHAFRSGWPCCLFIFSRSCSHAQQARGAASREAAPSWAASTSDPCHRTDPDPGKSLSCLPSDPCLQTSSQCQVQGGTRRLTSHMSPKPTFRPFPTAATGAPFLGSSHGVDSRLQGPHRVTRGSTVVKMVAA